jgi:hypothetical protein
MNWSRVLESLRHNIDYSNELRHQGSHSGTHNGDRYVLYPSLRYTRRKISASLGYVTERGKRKMERVKGEARRLVRYRFPSLPVPRGWAASNVENCPTFWQTLQLPSSEWICNGWTLLASALKMETVCFSETLPCTYESTRHQNPEEEPHHPHSRENLKSHKREMM